MRRRIAFTLVELLVVIGIIAILIGVLLPSLVKAKRQSLIIQCASNLHNAGQALFAYAADNSGNLPQFYADPVRPLNPSVAWGLWLWDMEAPTRDALVHYGVTQQAMYCPTTADTMNWVNSAVKNLDNSGPQTAWDYRVSYKAYPYTTGYGLLGYAWLTARPDIIAGGSTYPSTKGSLGDPFYHWDYQAKIRPQNTAASNGYIRPNVSSDTEIVMDAIVSQFGVTPTSFGDIIGGSANNILMPSAHLYGSKPDGGNILFMDGHVDWRPFSQMHQRVKCFNVGVLPVYWW